MSGTGKEKFALLIKNTRIIEAQFYWQDGLAKKLAAFIFTQAGRTAAAEKIQQCRRLLKEKTGAFSPFRGNLELVLASLLALSDQPQELLYAIIQVYSLLRCEKLPASAYLVLAAWQIAARSSPQAYSTVVQDTRTFYKTLRSRHPFLAGHKDLSFAALLGLAALDPVQAGTRIEHYYRQLKGQIRPRSSLLVLAQLLAISKTDEDLVSSVLDWRDRFRLQDLRLDQTYTLPFLGILAHLPSVDNTFLAQASANFTDLAKEKGFGALAAGRQVRTVFALALLTADQAAQLPEGLILMTLSNSIMRIILSRQAAAVTAGSP